MSDEIKQPKAPPIQSWIKKVRKAAEPTPFVLVRSEQSAPKNLFEWLDAEPAIKFPKRGSWRDGNRTNQNSGGRWLVRGPLKKDDNDPTPWSANAPSVTLTSKTLVRDASVGEANKADPDPENKGACLSNLIDHNFVANRHVRRAERKTKR